MKSRIIGVSALMRTFGYLFGTMLGELILKHTDNLSRTLQHADMSAADGQGIAALTVSTLESIRTHDMYVSFWAKAQQMSEGVDVNPPNMPRPRKAPRRFEAQRRFYSEVVVLTTLILVTPATNASSERSFSALRRVKSYLRSTMSQIRLNSLMVLHVHKELTDALNLVDIANEFVSNKPDHRLSLFGKFCQSEFVGVRVCSSMW